MMNKLIAIDFDGVLCDSINECLITSYNAYHIINKEIYKLNKISNESIEYFHKHRALAVKARDFYFLWDALYNIKSELLSYPLKSDKRINSHTLDYFNKIFYEERTSWMQTDNSNWLMHTKLFSEIAQFPRNIFNKNNIIILSSKDGDSIKNIFKQEGFIINNDNIYGAESFTDKLSVLEEYQAKYNIDPKQMYFLDDNIDNLLSVLKMDINLFIAEWGYVNKDQLPLVKKNNINILKLNELKKWLINI